MFSKKKFLLLTPKRQHKHAGRHLQYVFEKGKIDPIYRQMEQCLNLPYLVQEYETISNRFHLHMKHASVSVSEDDLLINRFDTLSTCPFGTIGVYLEGLRSAYNIGSILRTVEAFRLGPVYFSEKTPFINHPKVKKTAMGSIPHIPCKKMKLNDLPGPLIALETVQHAPSLFEYNFPKSFTLLIGNEEYGLSTKTLNQVDQIIQIPLFGSKNSLNVACALAIVAAYLSKKANIE